ncbi:MAG TPA: 2-oxoglutarate and iron-dependent oxygenase domain-containing protein [Pseudonocardiaceae bacterium]|nr:2-oxoglutarate and iron-dependent oxygenase domain-containing protein [Pseudonocardiaceae bacterium]
MTDYVPSIDLRPWFDGSGRQHVAEQVDQALRTAGFLLVTGHGVDTDLRAEVRALAREFFALPDPVKQRYAVAVGGRGWIPPGAEANGYAEGTATPADLKESFSLAGDDPTGDPAVDDVWFRPNAWPAEVPALRPVLTEYLAGMRALSDELMSVCGVALGLPADHFAAYLTHPTFGFNLNWYPPLRRVGPPEPGQYRIGPHTDFGTVTVLDREPGLGGLQVYTADGHWVDAPFDPDAFTINIGDLMARWTGDRWRSTRHRVLAPPADAPEEDLLSLVYFYEADHDAVIESLPSPIGTTSYPPVVWGDYLRAKLAAISVG